MGFIMGCAVFALLGRITLALIPGLGFNIANLILFVIGAFPGTLLSSDIYGHLFADSKDQLNSGWAIAGLFAVMLVGAVVSGSFLVWFKTLFIKPQRSDAP